jgi:hypothetical protein
MFGSKVNEGGDGDPRGHGSSGGVNASTLMTRKSGLTGVLAAEKVASVKKAPSWEDSHPPTRSEVRRVPTKNNTSQHAIIPEAIPRFFEVETD